jgi:hypothetical protein
VNLHGNEWVTILIAEVMNCANVGVIQGGRCMRLASETHKSVRIADYIVREKLEGNKAMETGIFGLVHAHAAASQLFKDPVMGYGLAEDCVGVRHFGAILGCTWMRVNEP